MPYIHIDINEFSDNEIQEEFEKRFPDALELLVVDHDEMRILLNTIYEKRRLGKDFNAELDEMILYGLGRIL